MRTVRIYIAKPADDVTWKNLGVVYVTCNMILQKS